MGFGIDTQHPWQDWAPSLEQEELAAQDERCAYHEIAAPTCPACGDPDTPGPLDVARQRVSV